MCKVPAPEESFVVHANNVQLLHDQLINKFWELDSVSIANLVTTTEKACEEHFLKTYTRDKTGIYFVKLPFHSSLYQLGDKRQSAFRRLKTLEYSLISNPVKYGQYIQFMEAYPELGYMKLVPQSEYTKKDA